MRLIYSWMLNTKDGRCHITDQASRHQASLEFNYMPVQTGEDRSSVLNSKDSSLFGKGAGRWGGGVGCSVRSDIFRPNGQVGCSPLLATETFPIVLALFRQRVSQQKQLASQALECLCRQSSDRPLGCGLQLLKWSSSASHHDLSVQADTDTSMVTLLYPLLLHSFVDKMTTVMLISSFQKKYHELYKTKMSV